MLVLGRARLVMVEGSDAIAKGMGAVVIFHTLLQSIMNTAMSMQLLKKLDKSFAVNHEHCNEYAITEEVGEVHRENSLV